MVALRHHFDLKGKPLISTLSQLTTNRGHIEEQRKKKNISFNKDQLRIRESIDLLTKMLKHTET